MRAGWKRVALAAATGVLVSAAAGCELAEPETTTVTTTVTAGKEGATGAGGAGGGAPKRPRGTMGIRYFGPVALGTTEARVREEFGKPDRMRDVKSGTGAAPQPNWIWNVGGGTVALKFDGSNRTLAGWSTDSPAIDSVAGVSVGESIKPVMRRFSDELIADPQGSGALILSEGAPGSAPALTFALVRGGNEIVRISGGELVQPAGD